MCICTYVCIYIYIYIYICINILDMYMYIYVYICVYKADALRTCALTTAMNLGQTIPFLFLFIASLTSPYLRRLCKRPAISNKFASTSLDDRHEHLISLL